MAYHVFLVGQKNFGVCVDRGIYGAVESEHDRLKAEVISSVVAIKSGDFVFFYVKNVGIYGLWRIVTEPFYDTDQIWDDSEQKYPYRFTFEPVVRKFERAVALSDVLDLKDKGKIWTFDLGTMTNKNHFIITTDEGKELIRLLLRNNPIFIPSGTISNPYHPKAKKSLAIELSVDTKGKMRYEGYLSAWFMKSFSEGKLKELIGDYKDFLNYVPTSFNKVMDIFLTHVTQIDSVEILHKYTCIELKTDVVKEETLKQIIRYENWLIRKLADGDSEMVQSMLVGLDFDDDVLNYRDKRRLIEEKPVRLIKYEVNSDRNDIILKEV